MCACVHVNPKNRKQTKIKISLSRICVGNVFVFFISNYIIIIFIILFVMDLKRLNKKQLKTAIYELKSMAMDKNF